MPDRFKLQQIWNRSHRDKPASEAPEENLITFAEYLQGRLPTDAAVLDAGCGRGRNTLYLSRLGYFVCGCDLSPVALEIAQERTRQAGFPVNFQISDLTCLPYADNSFAAVLCIHVLPYHLKNDIAKGIYELWRVIRPNGWLYVDFLDRDDAAYGCGQKLEEHTFLDPDGAPIHFSSRQEISEFMKGFSLERMLRNEWRSSPDRVRVTWAIWALKSQEEEYE